MITKKGKGIAAFDLLSELRKVEYEGSHEKSERWSMVSSLPQKMKHDLLRKIIPLTTSKEDNVSNVKSYST